MPGPGLVNRSRNGQHLIHPVSQRVQLTCVYICFALVLASAQQPDSADYSAFRSGVTPSFEELIPAGFALVACQRVPKSQRKWETEIERRYAAAKRKFREQVTLHWPYNDSGKRYIPWFLGPREVNRRALIGTKPLVAYVNLRRRSRIHP